VTDKRATLPGQHRGVLGQEPPRGIASSVRRSERGPGWRVSRRVRMAPLLVIGALVLAVPALFTPGEGRAQTRRGAADATRSESFTREWRLRGVVLAGPARFAVLQHGSSSRQQLLRVGEVLEHGVALVSITADRVVVGVEGGTVTLHLAHGGEPVSAQRPVPRSVPPAIRNRRGR
jgi:hypothetical protein